MLVIDVIQFLNYFHFFGVIYRHSKFLHLKSFSVEYVNTFFFLEIKVRKYNTKFLIISLI